MDDRRPYHVHARRVDTPSLALGINHFTYRRPRSLQGALSEIEGQGGLNLTSRELALREVRHSLGVHRTMPINASLA